MTIRHVPDFPGSNVTRTYARVNGANILVYTPAAVRDAARDIIVTSMHGGLNPSLEHPFLERLASLGIRTAFCVPDKSSFVDQFRSMDACMTYLRTMSAKVVLMGQSRGAAVMSAYQAIAENGSGIFQGPDRHLSLPDLDLQAADGLMLLDANFGTTVMHLMSINPAKGADNRIDPALDPLDPANGYAPDGGCHYTLDFRRAFLAAQRDRYVAHLDHAKERLAAIEAGNSPYADNEPFVIPDALGINNPPKLFAGDLGLLSRTKGDWPRIHADGSITTGPVECVRVDENNPRFAGKLGAAFVTTIKDYLWSAVDVDESYDYNEDSLSGIDFESSLSCSSGNVARIGCPLLLMGHTGGYEFITAEWSYHRAKSTDKTIAFLEGATHGWTPVNAQRYGDTLSRGAAYVLEWLEAGRFSAQAGVVQTASPSHAGPTGTKVQHLFGLWRSPETGATANFEKSGACELSMAPELTRFAVDADGTLDFFDRYGNTTTLSTSNSAKDRTWSLSADRLTLLGHTMERTI